MSMTCQILTTDKTRNPSSLMTLLYGLLVKMYNLQQNFCVKDLRKLAKWCAKWRIKLNLQKTKLIIFSSSPLARKSEPVLKPYGERLEIYPQVKFLGITFDSKLTNPKYSEEILGRCNTRYHRVRLIVNKKWGPSQSTILQIYKQLCPANFQIRLTFDHDSIGHNHQKNSMATEQVVEAYGLRPDIPSPFGQNLQFCLLSLSCSGSPGLGPFPIFLPIFILQWGSMFRTLFLFCFLCFAIRFDPF